MGRMPKKTVVAVQSVADLEAKEKISKKLTSVSASSIGGKFSHYFLIINSRETLSLSRRVRIMDLSDLAKWKLGTCTYIWTTLKERKKNPTLWA